MKVSNIVQESVIKTIPKKDKCKKAKWLSEEALQIAEKKKRRERQRRKRKIYPSEWEKEMATHSSIPAWKIP